MAVLSMPVVLNIKAALPLATLKRPDPLEANALLPVAVL
jgi:hypothetical protein